MKGNKVLSMLAVLVAFAWSNLAVAQYDDLYYDPDKDSGYYYEDS